MVAKIRAEITSTCVRTNNLKLKQAKISSSIGLHKLPTYDDLREMRYVKNVVSEVLRLYPPGKPYSVLPNRHCNIS
jgi:Cytochrome P450